MIKIFNYHDTMSFSLSEYIRVASQRKVKEKLFQYGDDEENNQAKNN